MIVAHAGIAVFFFNWITSAIFAGVFVPAIVLRILVEEMMLFRIEGYREYASTRKRLLPAIW
jgi:protein-S-isoprenylcysteine O-methyltransferase Ste14